MKLQDIAIADGRVTSVRTSASDARVHFIDYRDVHWRWTFIDVLAVENANIEAEDLDGVEMRESDPYLTRIRALVNEPNKRVTLYLFFTASTTEPRLRVVASDCVVAEYNERYASDE